MGLLQLDLTDKETELTTLAVVGKLHVTVSFCKQKEYNKEIKVSEKQVPSVFDCCRYALCDIL